MVEPVIGVLILNHNGIGWLSPLYESLLMDDYNNKRIYLVDNASEDGSVEMTLHNYPEVTVLQMSQNLGYSMAYNLSMPHAFADGCEYIIWSNNDILLEHGCIGKLSHAVQSDPGIGVLGPALLKWDSNEPHDFILGNYPHVVAEMNSRSAAPIDVDWIEGSFSMVSRHCIEAIGSLDPYLHLGWEDADFCRRARYHGWKVALQPTALIHHYSGGWTYACKQNELRHTWLRTKNYYIYQLTNPFQALFMNVVDAVHLFLVSIKQCFPKQLSSIIFHIRVFTNVMKEICSINKKWVRDRKGDKPPLTTRDFQSLHIEVMRNSNESSIERSLSLPPDPTDI